MQKRYDEILFSSAHARSFIKMINKHLYLVVDDSAAEVVGFVIDLKPVLRPGLSFLFDFFGHFSPMALDNFPLVSLEDFASRALEELLELNSKRLPILSLLRFFSLIDFPPDSLSPEYYFCVHQFFS